MIKNLIIIMLGGSLGAASRYLISIMAAKMWGVNFPWGTLVVNMVGCFFIGLIFALTDSVRLLPPGVRLFLITGFLGALTTFSSFSLEITNAVRAGLSLQPIMNIMINNLGGFGLTFLGYWLGSLK
ncbi:MAG: fluoride efflux transporter CrcB [Deltaproteobacteria bacterium]|nr:fluoride efflux transporter CrcB [Deltaproteobacteria bacterium]